MNDQEQEIKELRKRVDGLEGAVNSLTYSLDLERRMRQLVDAEMAKTLGVMTETVEEITNALVGLVQS